MRAAGFTSDTGASPEARLCVFAPALLVTVTVERDANPEEIHIHAGGQGFWVARMATSLGAQVTLCTALGGETGVVVRGLLATTGIRLLAVQAEGPSGAYVHVRSGGRRQTIAERPAMRLTRHERDELYGLALTAGLDADIALLTGDIDQDAIAADFYRHLTADLRANGQRVLADLAGPPLEEALRGGLDLLKISDEELVAQKLAARREEPALLQALHRLLAAGARNAIVTRADGPSLTLVDGHPVAIDGPRFEPVEPRGAGDALFAALGVALARDTPLDMAMRFAVAAGALNVTRHGLGTGNAHEIERLLPYVRLRALDERPARGGDICGSRMARTPDGVVPKRT